MIDRKWEDAAVDRMSRVPLRVSKDYRDDMRRLLRAAMEESPDILRAARVLLDYDEQDAGCVPTPAHLDAQDDVRAALAKADGMPWGAANGIIFRDSEQDR